MNFRYHKNFKKQFLKLPKTKQTLCKQRIALFATNQDHPLLNRHSLKGAYKNYSSLSAGGDLRIIYYQVSSEEVELVAVGSHSQLYK
ncbi:type II toxin-antitoxin system mRNA interferase toxin, RelE/StbE family [Candidatus Saccharibacteria bacterium]|nr:type II toxin-antitoxin system mRNA interferase toxin, RelE/StbE family [Candidatus Saccharibacteria bacterium]